MKNYANGKVYFTLVGMLLVLLTSTSFARASQQENSSAQERVLPQPQATGTRATTGPPPIGVPSDCPAFQQFNDVAIRDYFYYSVEYLVCRSNASGYSSVTFAPYNNVTRGEFSKVIVLTFGYLIDTSSGPHFNDVAVGSVFYDYIETAYHRAIVNGYNSAQCVALGVAYPCFGPNNNINRGEMAKLVSNSSGYGDSVSGQTFTDVPSTQTFYVFIERLKAHGVTLGTTGCTSAPCYKPGELTTRADMTLFIYRGVNKPSNGGAYNRMNAVTYADKWTTNDPLQPNYCNSSVYHCYSGGDCTNYLSQVMFAGGLQQIDTGWPARNTDWYWYGDASHSEAWTLTASMANHLNFYNAGIRFSVVSSVNQLHNGDAILFQLAGGSPGWNHARTVVGFGANTFQYPAGDPVGTRGLLTDQHGVARYHVLWDGGIDMNAPKQFWQVLAN